MSQPSRDTLLLHSSSSWAVTIGGLVIARWISLRGPMGTQEALIWRSLAGRRGRDVGMLSAWFGRGGEGERWARDAALCRVREGSSRVFNRK